MKTNALLLVCLLAATFAGTVRAADPATAEPAEVQAMRAHIDAFNRHDVNNLVERVSPDFVWYSVTSDASPVEVKGREALRGNLEGYFKSVPTVHSEVDGVLCAGAFVSFHERASWTSTKTGSVVTQSSIAVYEVHDGQITRAWYYPASK